MPAHSQSVTQGGDMEVAKIDSVGRSDWAGNEPLFANHPPSTVRAINRGMDLVDRPVEGFPGMSWFPPNSRPLLHRNVRIWPHPSRADALLMEPLPSNVSELGWKSREFGGHPDGIAIYHRGWIAFSLADNRAERSELPEREGNGQWLLGAPFEL